MSKFTVTNLQDASILALKEMEKTILIDPVYQRPGNVWSRKNQQLFIDSLLNRFDIPKFYFHSLTGKHKNAKYEYAIIDGRQRLEAIWSFMNGDYALDADFKFLEDPDVKAAELTYKQLGKDFPRLINRLHSRTLTVMVVTTDEVDVIEDMFSRLNEAVPLNAAEKRNAFPGPLPKIVREIVHHQFFEKRVGVPNSRYRHHDLAAKLLYLESSKEIVDTKRATLDYFVKENKKKKESDFAKLKKAVAENLTAMAATFTAKDDLLRSSGTIPVYYVLFSRLRREGKTLEVNRKALVKFEALRTKNRKLFAEEAEGVDFKLIEYDELAQSSNDAAAIKGRYETLRRVLDM